MCGCGGYAHELAGMTPFGEKLRALRAERRVSQKPMPEAIGFSAAYLSGL
jgi:hypothetical protein